MTKKTLACRILDKTGTPYSLHPYEWSEEALDAVSVAGKLHLDPSQVFKTLVLRGDKTGVLVAVIPGSSHIDLKRLAKASGNKSVDMVPVKDLQALTGYVRGGVSPLGMKKSYPCYIDSAVRGRPTISISAGQRGLQIFLAGEDLIKAVQGSVADISSAPDASQGV